MLGAKQIEWLKADLARQQGRRADRRADPPAVVRAASAMGLGDARRHGGDRRADAVPQRDGVLRAYPPRAPPSDRAYRAPCGQSGDVPAVAGRDGAEQDPAAVGSGAALARAWGFAACTPARREPRRSCASSRSPEAGRGAPGSPVGLRAGGRGGMRARRLPGRLGCRRRHSAHPLKATQVRVQREGDSACARDAGDPRAQHAGFRARLLGAGFPRPGGPRAGQDRGADVHARPGRPFRFPVRQLLRRGPRPDDRVLVVTD